jgi:NADPH-dependent 2,4-dienoyl-CoA reductase/sulfur reductase-like enzyme
MSGIAYKIGEYMKVVVIGGVAAGMSAASKIKRSVYDSKVVVYEKGETLSYGACGLPYYVGDEIKDINKMVIRTKSQFESMGMDIFTKHEVIEVKPEQKTVLVKELQSGQTFEDSYDKLIVASGASPIVPQWPGADAENIYVLSTLVHGEALKKAVMDDRIQHVTIVGAGFIGIELAETITGLGKQVTVIEFKNQILSHLDKEMAHMLTEELKSKGVEVRLGEAVEELLCEQVPKQVSRVKTNKNSYPTDLVVLSIGVRPNTAMFKEGSIDKLRNGAIKVNKKMETSITDIYAAGDCATVYHLVKDSYDDYIPLGTNANKQGKMVGAIIAGENLKFNGALGTSMIKVFELEGAKTGLSETEAISLGIPYQTATVKAGNHASYYPNPQPIVIKIIADEKTHKLLGVQLVGYSGTALRVDTFALAIQAGMTTEEIGWADFGYAPPFASVWDVMHIACNKIK